MRRLLVRLTLASAVACVLLVVAVGALTGIAWPLIFFRAALAVGIVTLAGVGVGLVLMRTALRRYYERRRAD